MLTELRVRDLAVISDVTLRLEPGLNVLTGETGTGKSILVDALSLLLGERASADLVRPGARRAVVEAAFDLRGAAAVEAAAGEAGLEVDDHVLVMRRDINPEGRNRAWVNGSPTTVTVLSALGRMLVDLHGQHEAQSLLRSGTQRDILDAFGDAIGDRKRVEQIHGELRDLEARERDVMAKCDDVRKRSDYLRHVVQEIDDVDPQPGEDEELTLEVSRLANVEELTRLAEEIAELVDGDNDSDMSVSGVIGTVRRSHEQLARIDESVDRWKELIETAAASVEELARAAREYSSGIERDPARLSDIESRRDRIYGLQQKYGATVAAVLETRGQSVHELGLLDTVDLDLAEIAEQRESVQADLTRAAGELTAKRTSAADQIAVTVGALLPSLGMPAAVFAVDLKPTQKIGPTGSEEITFTVQLNKGLDARPVAAVASGGELSRIMLALKVVLASHDVVQSLVFDEVDQGVGGETAHRIGSALVEVAESRQVLVITHLAQIASRAAHHIRVTKSDLYDKATAEVTVLDRDERVCELARMLGNQTDPDLLQHAKELVGAADTPVLTL